MHWDSSTIAVTMAVRARCDKTRLAGSEIAAQSKPGGRMPPALGAAAMARRCARIAWGAPITAMAPPGAPMRWDSNGPVTAQSAAPIALTAPVAVAATVNRRLCISQRKRRNKNRGNGLDDMGRIIAAYLAAIHLLLDKEKRTGLHLAMLLMPESD